MGKSSLGSCSYAGDGATATKNTGAASSSHLFTEKQKVNSYDAPFLFFFLLL